MASDRLRGSTLAAAPQPRLGEHRPTPGDRAAVVDVSGSVDVAGLVDGTLAEFLASQITSLDGLDPALGGFGRTARDSVLAGGKRLRPTFAYWGWRGLVGPGASADPVLPALAALELLHAFALAHDDVMDGSTTRRGRPTAHRKFAAEHAAAGRRGDPDRFGEAAAVLLGDLCLVWADRLMGRAAVPAERFQAARRCYDRMRVEAVAGQYLDILGEAEPAAWSVERALRVTRLKTASYTVQRPLHFGAALAGAAGTGAVLSAYSRYGLAVGEAFQLRDDLLGAYGDPLVTGKPAADDLRTGKPTALLMIAQRCATPRQRTELARTRDVGRLAALIAETDAVAFVEKMIDDRVADALIALGAAPLQVDARVALTGLAMAASDRRA
jgi:geranylgeranyl diphosphate synthase type I